LIQKVSYLSEFTEKDLVYFFTYNKVNNEEVA